MQPWSDQHLQLIQGVRRARVRVFVCFCYCVCSRGSELIVTPQLFMRAKSWYGASEFAWYAASAETCKRICHTGFNPHTLGSSAPLQFAASPLAEDARAASENGTRRQVLCLVVRSPYHVSVSAGGGFVVDAPEDMALSYVLPVCVVTYGAVAVPSTTYLSPFAEGRDSVRLLYHQTTNEGAEGMHNVS